MLLQQLHFTQGIARGISRGISQEPHDRIRRLANKAADCFFHLFTYTQAA